MNEYHGHTKNGQPRIYRIWRAMRFRCSNSSHSAYHRYGGRGIKVCKDWDESYLSFYNWAISHGYSPVLTIDRIDNDGNYEPANCRWASHVEQMNNKSSECRVEVAGVSKSVAAWAKSTGIYIQTLYRRYHKGIRGEEFIVPICQAKSRSKKPA